MAETSSDGGQLDLRDYLHVLWRNKWIVVLATLVMVGSAYGLSARQDEVYKGTARFRIVPLVNPLAAEAPKGSGASVATEIEVLRSAPVLDRVRAILGGQAPEVTTQAVGSTEFVEVTAKSGDPESAAAIPNAYVEAYRQYRTEKSVADLERVREDALARFNALQAEIDGLTNQLARVNRVTQPVFFDELTDQRTLLQSRQEPIRREIEDISTNLNFITGGTTDGTPAVPPKKPSAPQPVRNALLALPVGLIFGIGLVFLFEYLDDSIKSKDGLQRATGPGVPVLALIPAMPWPDRAQAHVVSLENPTSPSSEAYRSLRTSVQFLGLDAPLHCLQVTSGSQGEGKTTTTTNLALMLARAGERPVVVVDCDLRRPRLHEFFDLPNEIGFTSVLLGEVPVSAALQRFEDEPGLSVLVSGPIPSDPSELLASRRTAEVLASLRADGALVLLDTPPVLPVTDALVVSKWVDATLLVTTAGQTTRRQVQRAMELLAQVEAPLVGTVLNKAPSGSSGYGYGYRADYYGADKRASTPRMKAGDGRQKAPVGQ
ncbi:MAG: polysaccharide biosynthesis tyrosine autokinase [Actinomycetota bacterium]|jgi:succinoglycan biosynthesis transport protein ExoP|nr:polysaccharide biosynthesis tyrosine autokinase [Actinomycetota bacterium]MDP9451821.1 polysaccharide biosynthesis tyrosine autokinase [Actinomycetota bacterium]